MSYSTHHRALPGPRSNAVLHHWGGRLRHIRTRRRWKTWWAVSNREVVTRPGHDYGTGARASLTLSRYQFRSSRDTPGVIARPLTRPPRRQHIHAHRLYPKPRVRRRRGTDFSVPGHKCLDLGSVHRWTERLSPFSPGSFTPLSWVGDEAIADAARVSTWRGLVGSSSMYRRRRTMKLSMARVSVSSCRPQTSSSIFARTGWFMPDQIAQDVGLHQSERKHLAA